MGFISDQTGGDGRFALAGLRPWTPARPRPSSLLTTMSRPSRSSMGPPQNLGPHQDIVMGPPPLPPQASQPRDNNLKRAAEPDLAEKYARLVRKYKELEEVSIHFCKCEKDLLGIH